MNTDALHGPSDLPHPYTNNPRNRTLVVAEIMAMALIVVILASGSFVFLLRPDDAAVEVGVMSVEDVMQEEIVELRAENARLAARVETAERNAEHNARHLTAARIVNHEQWRALDEAYVASRIEDHATRHARFDELRAALRGEKEQ